MKELLLRFVFVVALVFTLNSCSSDSSETSALETSAVALKAQANVTYTYSAIELETMKQINDYRVSVGLNALEQINYISVESEVHDFYMIDNNVVNHDGFVDRCDDIIKTLGATKVGENIAYNYKIPEDAIAAWLNSPSHKANIVGNYTHFGISIRENAVNGRKYYTNIFAKI